MTIDDIRKMAKRHGSCVDIQINDKGDVSMMVSKSGDYPKVKILKNKDIELSPFDIVEELLKRMF